MNRRQAKTTPTLLQNRFCKIRLPITTALLRRGRFASGVLSLRMEADNH